LNVDASVIQPATFVTNQNGLVPDVLCRHGVGSRHQPHEIRTAIRRHRSVPEAALLHQNRQAYVLIRHMAFDSVRHSYVLNKFLLLSIPDHVYNWIESYFQIILTAQNLTGKYQIF